ncbi:hypothetical protein [Pseudomonas savastanoi]|uniref:Uncharacterized protein n=3 Tax=Pseudomonas savastanoi TaxID=29438 RepID=A0A267KEE6_PSESS|nr:hypothetical protein [Pseudomonas savastanoi]PAB32808.1 hypothetical protein CC205_13510 [Pseudomonas savastanoi pv. nerii]ARD11385.1 hypothetical protein PSA3335_10090 [Pseudomonas savastanoi pv. savastanoi NCPPB 3335]RMN71267.1 hypothetical protein ALQ55_01181 [Pseudomonas savastanoi pv. savastanoi]RMT72329.1 hypothetical protein ALP42_02559 [Pseudomonas savastanoi pv. nerii]RMT86425.1 hypothetical protein ALP41_00454 [Pseudomonas savastanoi pv. nerii]
MYLGNRVHWEINRRNTMEQATETTVKCTRCRKPADPVIYRNIIDQAIHPITNKKYVRTQSLPFCSEEHASHEQMSREG